MLTAGGSVRGISLKMYFLVFNNFRYLEAVITWNKVVGVTESAPKVWTLLDCKHDERGLLPVKLFAAGCKIMQRYVMQLDNIMQH